MIFLRRLLSLTLLFATPMILSAESEAGFSEAQLDQMLAPIALYPDSLLAQILTASTYPLEIVAAARWLEENENLSGDEAVEAAEANDWDPSVTALIAFPDVLKRMNDELEWTQHLGEAVLVQEEQVLASVQKLREKAYTAGNLQSRDEVEVRREKEIIYIESANPQIVYVPYYRPTVVYGSWWWHSHPPVYWKPFTHISVSTGSTHIIWSQGYRFSNHYFYSRPDWRRRHIVVHHHHHHKPRHVRRSREDWKKYNSGERWQHQPRHRRGARYRSPSARQYFTGKNNLTRGDLIDQRYKRKLDAEKEQKRREAPTANAVSPKQRTQGIRGEQQRTEKPVQQRRGAVRRESTTRAEQIQQRLIRNRNAQQRAAARRQAEQRSRTTAPTRRPTNIDGRTQNLRSRHSTTRIRHSESSRNRSQQPTAQKPSGDKPRVQQQNRRSAPAMIRRQPSETKQPDRTPAAKTSRRPTPQAEQSSNRNSQRSATRNTSRSRSFRGNSDTRRER